MLELYRWVTLRLLSATVIGCAWGIIVCSLEVLLMLELAQLTDPLWSKLTDGLHGHPVVLSGRNPSEVARSSLGGACDPWGRRSQE